MQENVLGKYSTYRHLIGYMPAITDLGQICSHCHFASFGSLPCQIAPLRKVEKALVDPSPISTTPHRRDSPNNRRHSGATKNV
eukprot:2278815-Pleurochrysis_carterae.AAC.7